MAGKQTISLDALELRRMYESGCTTRQIAEAVGASPQTVLRRLQASGVDVRPPGPARHELLRNPEWLKTQYATKTLTQIANEIGASAAVVRAWMERHGIERRPQNQHAGRKWSDEVRDRMSQARKGKYLGEANPNWRGGKVNPNTRLRASYDSKAWSQAVRERDGHKCTECGATGKLHAHHVKPWRDHPELRFEVGNGVTLCVCCHERAHGWRFPEWVSQGKSRTNAGHPNG